MTNLETKTIIGEEIKHAVYGTGNKNDIVFIKKNIHTDKGLEPTVEFIENYKRPFWISKPNFRKYKQKKESESLSKLKEFNCRQMDLPFAISKALGRFSPQNRLRVVCQSPYVYGADVTPPVLIKHANKKQYPNCVSANTLAVLDIETDTVKGTGEIISVALSFKDKAIVTATKDWIGDIVDIKEQFYAKLEENLGDTIKARNTNVEVYIGTSPADCIVEVIKRAHEWKPDVIGIWNINFDIPKIIEALEIEGFDLGDLLSDPIVPAEFRKAKYNKGSTQKVTATGKVTSKHPAECWHTVQSLSSFQFLDLMATYCLIRIAKGKSPSYALDYILNKHLGKRKLKFDAVKSLENTLQWHIQMQTHYKPEYMVYNLFDCIGCELLDEAIKDIAFILPTLNGISEYATFSSQPRRTCDNLHFFYLESENEVFGTTSDNMEEELSKYVYNLKDWVVTLDAHQIVDNGIPVFMEVPELRSYIRIELYDLDCVSTYPTTEIVANISKATTFMELCKIKGLDEITQRSIGINLTGGPTNALEIAHHAFGFPLVDELLDDFLQAA